MTLSDQLQATVNEWVASGGDEAKEQAVLELLEQPEIKALPYVERNRPWVTSSKLKALDQCAYHAYLKYVKEVPSPVEDEDYFLIGSAVDDYLTHGEQFFEAKYEKVARRSEGAEKVQLTGAQWRTVQSCHDEFTSRAKDGFFPAQPKKRNVIWLMYGLPMKAELDHWDAERHVIGDIKTCANITTFNPSMYLLQFSFYSLGIAMKWGESVDAELFTVDKATDFSRSHKWILSRQTLMGYHHRVEQLAQQWRDCLDTGIWPHVSTDSEEGRRVCWNSEYWPICPFCKTAPASIL